MSEDYEPDSAERQCNDAFVEALATRNHSAAADTLRKLKLLGGSLDDVTLDLLADILVGATHPDLFPRIVIRRRQRGRPPAQKKEIVGLNLKIKSFLNAIASRDAQAAADILRHTSTLGATELEILADLFSTDPKGDIALPCRLTWLRHRRGNPVYSLKSKAQVFMLNLLVEKASASKIESAIQEAMQKSGRCRSTIQKARRDSRRAELK